MKTTLRFLTAVAFALVSTAFASKWSDEYLAKIKAMGNPPSPEDIALLATLASNEASKEDVQLVRTEAWESLKRIDDFPNVLLTRIEEFKKDWKRSGITNHYDFERAQLIRSMGGLPDVRVVGKLGGLLSDMEWTEDPIQHARNGADYGLTSPNGILAAQALARLIENPPLNKKPEIYFASDIEPWRLWFAQVEAGNRTFRFKGDPQEYSLAGPVTESGEPKNTRPNRDTNNGQVPASPVEAVATTVGVPIWALGLAGGLLAVALWFAMRRKPAAS